MRNEYSRGCYYERQHVDNCGDGKPWKYAGPRHRTRQSVGSFAIRADSAPHPPMSGLFARVFQCTPTQAPLTIAALDAASWRLQTNLEREVSQRQEAGAGAVTGYAHVTLHDAGIISDTQTCMT